MSNYKRKKSRKSVKCTVCTDNRKGNSLSGGSSGDYRLKKQLLISKEEIKNE